MIALALPWVFAGAVLASMAIAALHLLSVRRPPSLALPTARFLPDRDVRAVSRTRTPSDLLLLLLRIVALLAAGLAASGPSWRPSASSRITLVASAANIAIDSAAVRALLAIAPASDASVFVIQADANAMNAADADAAAALFPLALREASRIVATRGGVDSIDLHLLLARIPDTAAAGWRQWRAAWPGRVVLHAPPLRADATGAGAVARETARTGARRMPLLLSADSSLRVSAGDDPVRSALLWHWARLDARDGVAARVDTIWLSREARMTEPTSPNGTRSGTPNGTRSGSTGAVHIHWPRTGMPAGWSVAAPAGDSAIALVSDGVALMGPWPVRATYSQESSSPRDTPVDSAHASGMAPGARVLSWWSDGRVAATERNTATSCVRTVGVDVSLSSDVLLSASANGLFAQLLAPCAVPVAPTSINAQQLTQSQTDGRAAADAQAFRVRASQSVGLAPSRVVSLLLALAVVVLVAEGVVRSRMSGAVA